MIRGGGDFLLKLVARDTAHENQLTQRLTGAANVSRVQTLQTIRTSRTPRRRAALTAGRAGRCARAGARSPRSRCSPLAAARGRRGRTPLSPDEAYYWVWSRAPAAGLSRPSADGRAVHLRPAPRSPATARSASGCSRRSRRRSARSSLAARRRTALFPGAAPGSRPALLLNATLLFGVGAVTMTPDTPLLLFWTAGARRASVWLQRPAAASAWLLAGVAGRARAASANTPRSCSRPRFWCGCWSPRGMRRWLAPLAAMARRPRSPPRFSPRCSRGTRRMAGRASPSRAAAPGDLAAGPGAAVPRRADRRPDRAGDPAASPCSSPPASSAAVRRARAIRPGGCSPRSPPCRALVFLEHALGDRVQANWPAMLYPAAAIAAALLGGAGRRLAPARHRARLRDHARWSGCRASPPRSPLPLRLDPTLMRLGGWPGSRRMSPRAPRADARRLRRRRQLRRTPPCSPACCRRPCRCSASSRAGRCFNLPPAPPR